jgi:hypothetical protein
MQPTQSFRRDPIRDSPLRDPGQSLRQDIETHVSEVVLPWIAMTVLVVIAAGVEWIRWWVGADYHPIMMTVVAAVVAGVAGWKMYDGKRLIRQWKLGMRGERSVGQFLQAALLPRGYVVIHDVCIDDFNVDHALIGPAGIYAVEVKTHSKPHRGDARVTYDGQEVLVDGFKPDRDPVAQARAGADRLRLILERFSGRTPTVRPVVLYPGWYVDRQPPGVETWVLNEKAFVKFLEHEPPQLPAEDCRLFAESLSRYVREQLDR